MLRTRVLSAAVLAAAAGQAHAQPVIDGVKDASYGAPLWVQNQPTTFGDNQGVGTCSEDVSGAAAVTTGVEYKIPLSLLGNPAGSIKVTGFLLSGDRASVSNQVIGGLPAGTRALGEPREVDFTTFAGNQFVTVSTTAGSAPTVDGTLDAGVYGTRLFTQNLPTTAGDNTDPDPLAANGSEIDGVYAVKTATDLHIFVTGNLAGDGRKLELFVDSVAGGQQRLRGDNPDVNFNGLNRLGDDGSGNGLTFDAGFEADFYITLNGSGSPTPTFYADVAPIATNGGGTGEYIGDSGGGSVINGSNGVAIGINNSNTAGVTAQCPPPNASQDYSTGSEINALYGQVVGNRLYLMITGNIQTNFNKLELFFDVQPGGQNTLRGDNVDIDFNGLNRMGEGEIGDPPSPAPGLTFDADFAADYWLSLTNGGDPVELFSQAAVLRVDGPLYGFNLEILDYGAYDGGLKSQNNPIDYEGDRHEIQDGTLLNIYTNFAPRTAQLQPNSPVPDLIFYSIDNSNVAGVTGVDPNDPGAVGDVSGAAAVTTGVEISIDLDELGWDGVSPIKVAGFNNSNDHGFVSNQVIGGLPNTPGQAYAGNLGEIRLVDFGAISGTQYVVVPLEAPCYADCTGDGSLSVADFTCFRNAYLAGNTAVADCTGEGSLSVADFTCFRNAYLAGCP